MVVEITNREDAQLSLFKVPVAAVRPEPAKAAGAIEGQTLHQIVYLFLQKRQAPVTVCRVCGCHGDSCRLSDGDTCSLNESTGYCTAPRCCAHDRKSLDRISSFSQGGRHARRVA